MTNDTDRWKSVTATSIDIDIDHVSLYGRIVWRVLNLTAYCCSVCAVFNCIDYGRGTRNGWKKFNSFEELELTFAGSVVRKAYSYRPISIASLN